MADALQKDPSLKRCFGEDKNIIDCDWPYISTLRTVQAPHEAMPRLRDLLEYLTTPGLEDIWILLDIKVPFHTLKTLREGIELTTTKSLIIMQIN